MKKYLYYILITIPLITAYYSYSQRKSFEDKLWNLNSNLLETHIELSDLKEKQMICLSTNGALITDSIRNKLPLHTFILRLHNGICLSCYAENIQLLYADLEKKGKDLFVLGSYTFDGGLKDEISIIQGKVPKSSNIPKLSIMPADSLGIPYVFLINENGQIKDLHFLLKKDYSLTSEYLKSIERLGLY